MRRLLPRGYLFTVLGIAVGVAAVAAAATRMRRTRGSRSQCRHVASVQSTVNTPTAAAQAAGWWRWDAVNSARSRCRGRRRAAVKGRQSARTISHASRHQRLAILAAR